MSQAYRTAPEQTTGMPSGVPFIIGNEAAERFSFYGFRTILVVFMTQYLVTRSGQLDTMNDTEAREWFHWFVSAVYFFPILGGILADSLLGKYRTILWFSILYCFGHLALAVDSTRLGLLVGLSLIAVGAGAIKACVAAHVGDQFSSSNQALLPRAFGWFYFSINFGSAFGSFLTPWLLKHHGPHWAFGVPGIAMLIATIVFWMGRNRFAHIPPAGKQFVRDSFSLSGLKSIGRLVSIFALLTAFWSLYDQSSSAWIQQARHMDRNWLGFEWQPAQIHTVNPILILMFIPLFSYVIYPAIDKIYPLTPLRKIGIGFVLTIISFLIPAYAEKLIVEGQTPHMIWQIWAYVFLTAGEVMVSITSLEFAYTQAPKGAKSLLMALNYAAISLGNVFTAVVNSLMGAFKVMESGPGYYLFFAGVMTVATIIYIFVAMRFKTEAHLQSP
ncbi:MAG TPA: POT family MFS transporter [Methylomirabilota bacterium]|nr:POT family MFS transporter [Methylomirabilota bacterium]